VILITGSSGNVGSALLGELRAGGHPARAAYRSPDRTAGESGAGREAVTLDLSRPRTLPPALEDVDAIFLLAPSGPGQPRQESDLIEAARAARVSRIVKLSAWRAGEGLTPIARWHKAGEEALRSSGLAWTLLRPNFYMQNFVRQNSATIRETRSFAQPASGAAISFVDTRDIARVAARVLTSPGHDGKSYEITGPEALTYEQAAGVFSGVLGESVRFEGLPEAEARADMLRSGLPPGYADVLIEVSRAYRDGGAERVTSAVSDLTGRAPVSLAQFVRDNLPAFR
jgi:uncharacterized protein YbjT (DUF2867 family)